jgi:tetratricopeptide (TPR) repeat protein
MMKRVAIIFPLLLAACAQAPQKVAVAPPQAAQPEPPKPQVEKPQLALPHMELDGAMLYDFLLGEVASQRDRPELAAQIYLDLAKSTRDPRVARRAAYLAFDARRMDNAIEAFNLWLELEPDASQAKEMLSTLLLSGGRLEEARPYLVGLLSQYPNKAAHTFMQIYPMVARNPDREAVFALLRDLAQPYPRVAEAHWALAQAAEASGRHQQALDESRQAYALRPDWDMAVLLEAQLMLGESPKQALALLKNHLASHPDNDEVRLFYARALMAQNRFAEARVEFKHLLGSHPDSSELAIAVALLSLQMGELDQAEQGLRQALANGSDDGSLAYYYLGQVGEAKKNDDEALQNYRRVQTGEYVYSARLREVYLLNKAGKRVEALQALHQIAAQNNQQRVQLLLAEAQLLSDAQQYDAAYQVLLQGLEKLPNHPDLLYEAAMVADKLGKPEDFERMMRKVIQIQPDQAQAYNALGYSLLDRNERVPEAMGLVEKAYQLAPDDAGIMDSVGWGHFRMGNLSKSLEFLRRAYTADPDPEIAAHLGEVLWVQGDRTQAKKIWGDALKSHPDSTVLQGVVKRLDP